MSLASRTAHELTRLGAAQLARHMAAGDVSAREVVAAHIARIEALQSRLNALVVDCFEQAQADAAAADDRQARGEPLGLLHGVPFTVKENFAVAGTDSTMGVRQFVGKPDLDDCPLVSRLRAAGAIVLGKTNVPQLLLSHETDNPVFGRTNNPWDLERSPGGSSGGEAALIAAGGSPLGLASDLGGSIRQPAHVTGICGLKPTAARLTTAGTRRNLPGLEAIPVVPGPMARRVEDLELAMRVMIDPARTDVPPVAWRDPAAVSLQGLRVGYFVDDGVFHPSPAIRRAVETAVKALADRGVIVEPFDPPEMDVMLRLYLGIVAADGLSELRRLLGNSPRDWRVARLLRLARLPNWSRPAAAGIADWLGQARLAALLRSSRSLSADGFQQLVVELQQFDARFFAAWHAGRFDALLFPPHALPALVHGDSAHSLSAASYCFLPNLLGVPAGVVPIATVGPGEESDRSPSRDRAVKSALHTETGSAGLPLGVQVAALPWREDVALSVMGALEARFPPPECPLR